MRLVILMLLAPVGGCSFLFTSSPPERITAYSTLNCTTSRAAPAVDGVLGALSAVGTIYEANAEYPTEYIVAGAAWTLLYASSAIYGSTVVSSCEAATEKRDALVESLDRERFEGRARQPRPATTARPPAAVSPWELGN